MPVDTQTVWRMALGAEGQYESDALEHNVIFVGFGIEESLEAMGEDEIKQLVASRFSHMREGKQRSRASKLNMFAVRMQPNDLVVVHLKQQIGNLAIGRITGPYRFDVQRQGRHHTRDVEWILPSLPISQEWESHLPYVSVRGTINPIRDEATIIKIHNAVLHPDDTLDDDGYSSERDQDIQAELSIVDIARAQIAALIHERFPGKEMERLVAGVLEAEGYTIAPPVGGADSGVDVVAGHGILGFEEPLLCVQVKHEINTTSAATVQRLRGAVEQFGAKQGLFVSWGGFKSSAKSDARESFFRIRLWDANDLIDAVCRNYEGLSPELREEIPLQRVWTVIPDSADE